MPQGNHTHRPDRRAGPDRSRTPVAHGDSQAWALRLAPGERAYLFGSARQRPRNADKPATTAAPSPAGLVADLSPMPAQLLAAALPGLSPPVRRGGGGRRWWCQAQPCPGVTAGQASTASPVRTYTFQGSAEVHSSSSCQW